MGKNVKIIKARKTQYLITSATSIELANGFIQIFRSFLEIFNFCAHTLTFSSKFNKKGAILFGQSKCNVSTDTGCSYEAFDFTIQKKHNFCACSKHLSFVKFTRSEIS